MATTDDATTTDDAGSPASRPDGDAVSPGSPVAQEVEAALADVDDLSTVPVADHHARLERVHEVLHDVLTRDRDHH